MSRVPPEDPMRTRATDNGPADGWRGARIGAVIRDRQHRATVGMGAEIDLGVPGTPVVTMVFLAATVLATVAEFATFGASPSTSELARAGGSSLGAFATGAWWKFLASNLLHANLAHIAMNAIVIFLTGRWLEHLAGRMVMIATIFWSALLASAGSTVLEGAVTIGASGVAFGIIGCAVAIDPRGKTPVGLMARQLFVVNIVLTFVVPGIAIGGHLGGLVAGLLVGWLCWNRTRTEEHPAGRPRRVATVATALAAVPFLLLLAVGPRVLPDEAAGLRGTVTAPLLARQLSGADLTSGRTIHEARCSATAEPLEYDCTVDDDQANVRFRRSDDQWGLVIVG